jgi:hypothetical protein
MNDFAEWVGLSGYTPEQWSAFGTMLTAVVAIAAAVFAWQQVRHARQIRDEQAQPNVIIDFEESASSIHLDLVIKNIGQTVAYDVRVVFNPPIATTEIGDRFPLGEASLITKGIPTMPPGRTWRAMFDNMPQRFERKDLPRTYDVQITYRDSRGKEYSLPYRLDLGIYYDIWKLTRYGTHDIAKSMREINRTLKGLVKGGRLNVSARDQDYHDWADDWQYKQSDGNYPTLRSPIPAGRPSPHKYDHLGDSRPETLAQRMKRRRK